MRRRVIADGPVDVATAWARYEDPNRWSEWAPQIRDVDAGGPLAPGLRGVVRGPAGVAIPFHVETVDAVAHAWSWTVTMLGVRVSMRHDLVGTARGTIAGLTVDGPAPIVLAYAPAARAALGRLCRIDP